MFSEGIKGIIEVFLVPRNEFKKKKVIAQLHVKVIPIHIPRDRYTLHLRRIFRNKDFWEG